MPGRFDKEGKQLRLLQSIADHVWIYGYQPSLRELANQFGYRSPGYIQWLLSDLRDRKVVRFDTTARAIAFRWQDYVTEETLSRHNGASVGGDSLVRHPASGRKRGRQPVGKVPKPT